MLKLLRAVALAALLASTPAVAQIVNPLAPMAPPATITAGTPWTSALQVQPGSPDLTVSLVSSAAGTITMTRYADVAGTAIVDASPLSPPTANLSAGVASGLIVQDGHPYASFTLTITINSGTASISKFGYTYRRR